MATAPKKKMPPAFAKFIAKAKAKGAAKKTGKK
jgi:hypothetical protein